MKISRNLIQRTFYSINIITKLTHIVILVKISKYTNVDCSGERLTCVPKSSGF
jgi:hypothetical protein